MQFTSVKLPLGDERGGDFDELLLALCEWRCHRTLGPAESSAACAECRVQSAECRVQSAECRMMADPAPASSSADTPEGVHIFRHDLQAGVSTNGKANAAGGYKIRFYGRRQQTDWRVSLEAILDKMERSGCTRLALVEFDSMSEAT